MFAARKAFIYVQDMAQVLALTGDVDPPGSLEPHASSAGCRCTRSRLPGWCWQQLQTPRSAQGLQVPKSNAGRRGPGSGGLLVSLCCDLAFCFCRVEGVFEARLQLRPGGGLRQLLPSGLQRHWRTGFLTSVTCHCKANISDVVPGGSGDGTRRMGWTGVHAPVEGILRTLGRAAKDLHFTVNDAADEVVNLVVLRAAGAGWGLDAESVPDTVQPCSGQGDGPQGWSVVPFWSVRRRRENWTHMP